MVQEARLKVAAAELNSAQEKLDDKQRELDKVQALYDGAVREKQVITNDKQELKKEIEFFFFRREPHLWPRMFAAITRFHQKSRKFLDLENSPLRLESCLKL